MSALCYPVYAAVSLIREIGLPVVEIGGGDGQWMRALREEGVDIVSWDKSHPGEGVRQGDHDQAAADGSALLAVWPPDGNAVQSWIRAAQWEFVIIAADFERLALGDSLAGFNLVTTIDLPPGLKGGSKMRLYFKS